MNNPYFLWWLCSHLPYRCWKIFQLLSTEVWSLLDNRLIFLLWTWSKILFMRITFLPLLEWVSFLHTWDYASHYVNVRKYGTSSKLIPDVVQWRSAKYVYCFMESVNIFQISLSRSFLYFKFTLSSSRITTDSGLRWLSFLMSAASLSLLIEVYNKIYD